MECGDKAIKQELMYAKQAVDNLPPHKKKSLYQESLVEKEFGLISKPLSKKDKKMDSEQFMLILDNCDYKPFKYSGRRMYGKDCIAIRVRGNGTKNIIETILDISSSVADDDLEEYKELVKVLRETETDNLGHDTVMYWSNMEWAQI